MILGKKFHINGQFISYFFCYNMDIYCYIQMFKEYTEKKIMLIINVKKLIRLVTQS
jgi:hypothetical protein